MKSSSKLLGELFTEDIYIINEDKYPEEGEKQPDEIKLNTKGSNKKGVLILVYSANDEFLPGDEDELLRKILASVGLTYEDVVIVNSNGINFEEVSLPTFSIMISFGVPRLPIFASEFKKYSLSKHEDIQCLVADDLSSIAQNIELKTSLWNALKGMFL